MADMAAGSMRFEIQAGELVIQSVEAAAPDPAEDGDDEEDSEEDEEDSEEDEEEDDDDEGDEEDEENKNGGEPMETEEEEDGYDPEGSVRRETTGPNNSGNEEVKSQENGDGESDETPDSALEPANDTTSTKGDEQRNTRESAPSPHNSPPPLQQNQTATSGRFPIPNVPISFEMGTLPDFDRADGNYWTTYRDPQREDSDVKDIRMDDADTVEEDIWEEASFLPETDEEVLGLVEQLQALSLEESSDRWMEGSKPVVACESCSICEMKAMEQLFAAIEHLLVYAKYVPNLWEVLIGAYFCNPGRNPHEALEKSPMGQSPLCGRWEWDWVRQDQRNRWSAQDPAPLSFPPSREEEFLLQTLANYIQDGREDLFMTAISRWQVELAAHDPGALERILQHVGWCCDVEFRPEWQIIANLKKMAPSPQKDASIQQACQERPLFANRCLVDPACGFSSSYLIFQIATFYYKLSEQFTMEYHAVPPEERARDEKGNPLPWGYVYKDESRNPRRQPEETGPFGKRRNTRYHSTRSATRTGTPAKRENPNVAEFGRLFALQQEQEQDQEHQNRLPTSSSVEASKKPAEKVATECILYGYKDKGSEWKVIDKFERISQGFICEDYPRSDPELNPRYPQLLSGGDVVIRENLSADANRKAKKYAGGFHWIKVTFDSSAAADRACYFSPQDIDGFLVHCEIYHGQGPREDAPVTAGKGQVGGVPRARTVTEASSSFPSRLDTTDRSTLPRSFTVNPSHAADAPANDMDSVQSHQSTATASSATVTGPAPENTVRQRQPQQQKEDSEFMTHIPTVRRAVVRPVTEALPPQPTLTERFLRSIPILSWFTGDIVGDGPVLREDGSFDYEKSNTYWRFWYSIDKTLGTDLCGLKEEAQ